MQEALDLVQPTAAEKKQVKQLIEKISKTIKLKDVKIEVGGSIAKDTWLKGEHDLDIYVKFDPKKYSGKNISQLLKKELAKKHKIEIVHGSRDYYRIDIDNYVIEVIPIVNIKKVEQAQNITDISPFHVKWVKKHKKISSEIRLAKAFCKANNLYGAESYIGGFSGYVLEILTMHYGSFKKLLREVSKWEDIKVLDPEKHYGSKNILHYMNRSKLDSPLILVDPVQAERNAAAGVGEDKYNKFRKLAKEYLKKSSLVYFRKEQFNFEEIKKKSIVLEATATRGKRDVIGARLLKTFEFLQSELKRNDFKIKCSNWHWELGQKAHFWFQLEEEKISKTKKHYGPPTKMEKNVAAFKKKWHRRTVKIEGARCYLIVDREFTDSRKLITKLLKNKYLKGKAKNLKII